MGSIFSCRRAKPDYWEGSLEAINRNLIVVRPLSEAGRSRAREGYVVAYSDFEGAEYYLRGDRHWHRVDCDGKHPPQESCAI